MRDAVGRRVAPYFGGCNSLFNQPELRRDLSGSPFACSSANSFNRTLRSAVSLASDRRFLNRAIFSRLMYVSTRGFLSKKNRRERDELSVTDGCRRRGGDPATMRVQVPESVVNSAQSCKFHEMTNRRSMAEAAGGFPGVAPEPLPSCQLVDALPDATAPSVR